MQAALQPVKVAVGSGCSNQTPYTVQGVNYVINGVGPLRARSDHYKFSVAQTTYDLKESLIVVSGEGLEPSRLPTRPSNVRVYQFRHPDEFLNSQRNQFEVV